jgi:predicted dehydrogenase
MERLMAKIAHVGHGYWGKNLARSLAKLDSLAALVDPHAPDIASVAASYGVPVRSLDEVLADSTIDAVSLATPAHLHFDQARQALEAGKHVMVEKPITLDVAEAESLAAYAQDRGLVLMVGHLMQYHPVFVALRALIAAGELGKLHYCYSNRLSFGKLRAQEDVMWSFAPHDLSMLLSIAGSPTAVSASGHSVVTPGIADIANLQLDFPDGVRGHVQVSWLHPFKEQRLVVIGAKGTAVFEDSQPDWAKKLTLYRHEFAGSADNPVAVAGGSQSIAVEPGEPLLEECRHFIDCVDRGLSPRTDGREAIEVLKVLQRGEEALRAHLSSPASKVEPV